VSGAAPEEGEGRVKKERITASGLSLSCLWPVIGNKEGGRKGELSPGYKSHHHRTVVRQKKRREVLIASFLLPHPRPWVRREGGRGGKEKRKRGTAVSFFVFDANSGTHGAPGDHTLRRRKREKREKRRERKERGTWLCFMFTPCALHRGQLEHCGAAKEKGKKKKRYVAYIQFFFCCLHGSFGRPLRQREGERRRGKKRNGEGEKKRGSS